MKAGCLLTVLLLSCIAQAQNSFVKQFRAVVQDTANGFSRYRGAEKVISKGGHDRIIEYASTSNLENTRENKILYIGDSARATYAYLACIADSAGESEGKMICDIWKDKVTAVLENAYPMKKHEVDNGFSGEYGWVFQGERFGISVSMDPVGNTALKKVSVMISYFIDHKLK